MKKKLITDYKKTGGGLIKRRQVLKGMSLGALTLAAGNTLSFSSALGAPSGDVNMLVWEGYEPQEAFAHLSDVNVNRSFMSQNDDTITKTKNAGDFDIMTIFQGQINALMKLDRTLPIDTSRLPSFNQLYPFFQNSNSFRRNGDLWCVPCAWGDLLICYNAEKIDAPKKFDDLMDPSLKGKISFPDDPYAVITSFAQFAGMPDINNLTPAQLDETMALLAKFKPQLLNIATSYGELPAQFKRGEILVSVNDIRNTMASSQADGLDVRAVVLDEGAWAYCDSWHIVKGIVNEEAAYAVIDATISKEGQAIIGNNTALGMCNPSALADINPDYNQIYQDIYDDPDSYFAKSPLPDGMPVDNEGGFASHKDWLRAWDKFKAL